MRRGFQGFLSAGLCGALACALLIGCSGGKYKDPDEDEGVPTRRTTKKTGGGAAAAKLTPVKGTSYDGVIKGVIRWTGQDKDALMKVEGDKLREAIKTNRDYCLTGTLPGGKMVSKPQGCEVDQQEYRIGKNGNLGNVFVWIQPEDETKFAFEIPEDQLKAAKSDVVIGQPHCAFVPHAAVHFPSYYKDGKHVPTGQRVRIINDALVDHNASIAGTTENLPDNVILPARKGEEIQEKTKVFIPDRAPIVISCSVHGWMKAYLRVFDHPYATVSSVGADLQKKDYENLDSPAFGTYEIKGVPVGAKVKLFAWHEKVGMLPGSGKVITLAKENKEDFEAK